MEQRPLRLGDIVDDYCPRERRLTNHAIVAIVEQTIRQTRCTTCDADHIYKEGRVPRRRREKDGDLADLAGGQLVIPRAAAADEAPDPDLAPVATMPAPVAAVAGAVQSGPGTALVASEDDAAPAQEEPDRDGWPAHRTLIRATLPRPVDGEPPPPRPIPEFTMHQRPQHRGGFRGGGGGWHGAGSGRNGNGPERNGNVMPGQGHGGSGGGGRHRRHGSRHKRPSR